MFLCSKKHQWLKEWGREFTTRVRKRSFLVLTLVVPILLAGFYAFLMWMLLKDDTQDRKIAVINQSVLETPFEQINNNTFEYLNTPVDESGASEFLRQHDYYALISIPENIMDHPEIPVYSFSQVPMELKNEIAAQLRKKIEDIKRAKVIAESQVPDLEEQLGRDFIFQFHRNLRERIDRNFRVIHNIFRD